MFHSSSREWLAASVLSQSADSFVAYLQEHQFEAATVQVYLHVSGHFGRWLTEQRLPLSAIDELLVDRFVVEHLPECRCPAPCQRRKPNIRAAVAHLLEVLRNRGLISTPLLGPLAVHEELTDFDVYLDGIAGLATATRTSRRMWVRKFLLDRFGDGPIRIDRLKPGDIAMFLRNNCGAYTPGTCGVLGDSLRSYFRFRALQFGDLAEPLSAAVPTPARWRPFSWKTCTGATARWQSPAVSYDAWTSCRFLISPAGPLSSTCATPVLTATAALYSCVIVRPSTWPSRPSSSVGRSAGPSRRAAWRTDIPEPMYCGTPLPSACCVPAQA